MTFSIARWISTGSLVAVLAAAGSAVMAQPVPDWSVVEAGAGGVAIAVDRGNNSYVAGTSAATTIQLTRISPAGATLWQRSLSGGLSRGTWVGVDAADNAIVTGYRVDSAGTSLGPVVLKFDPAGNLVWQDITAATYHHAVRGEADAAGNVYVLWRSVQLNAGAPATLDMNLTKYSPAGVRQWTRTFGASHSSADGMTVSASGQTVVAGISSAQPGQSRIAAFDTAGNALWSTAFNSSTEPGLAPAPGGGFYAVGADGLGFLVARFDAGFAPLWNRLHAARGGAQRAAVDAAGNVLVSGAVDTNTGQLQVVLYDWMTLKLDPNGTLLWSRTYGQPSIVGDVPRGLAIGIDGAVYVTGQSGALNALGSIQPSTATVKYGADGTQVWAANTLSSNGGLGLRLGTDGGVFVLGQAPQTAYRYPQSGAPNLPPTALASASPSAGPAPLSVAFSAAGSVDPDGRIAGYAWDFGDGQGSTDANPAHTYAVGSYTARLTVTDTLGASAMSAPISISSNLVVAPAQPTAVTLGAASVVGGNSTMATVKVSTTAGVTLTLGSSNTRVATVPATLVIPAGASSATFTIKTLKVSRDTAVTITAKANGATAAATLTVRRR